MKRFTRQWLRKAESDIAVARHLFKLKPLPSDEICFHCQQAIEKYFKGLLAESGLAIQKTDAIEIRGILAATRCFATNEPRASHGSRKASSEPGSLQTDLAVIAFLCEQAKKYADLFNAATAANA